MIWLRRLKADLTKRCFNHSSNSQPRLSVLIRNAKKHQCLRRIKKKSQPPKRRKSRRRLVRTPLKSPGSMNSFSVIRKKNGSETIARRVRRPLNRRIATITTTRSKMIAVRVARTVKSSGKSNKKYSKNSTIKQVWTCLIISVSHLRYHLNSLWSVQLSLSKTMKTSKR